VAARDPRSRNIVSILPDGTPVYDEGDARLTSPALVDQPLLPQPAITELLPAPPSAVELGNMFLRTHARGDQVGAQALRDYAESRSGAAPLARVEPLKGGEYDRMNIRVDGIQIPRENRTLLRGNPEAAARVEKKLPQQQSNVTLSVESNIAAPAKSADEMTDDEWLAATRFYRSGKTKNAQLPNGKRVILTSEATEKTFRENSRDFLLSVRPKTKPATSNDTFLKIQADQANIKPPVSDEVVTKSGYKVESYQGGFRVLDPEGKQYSWHTNRQAADDKAAELNSSTGTPKSKKRASIKEVYEAALNDSSNKDWHNIRKVTKDEAIRLSRVTGLPIDNDTVHIIDADAVRHANNHHGFGNELREDQIPITLTDIEAADSIISSADEVSLSEKESKLSGKPVVRYKKRINGHVIYLEEYREGRNKLAFKTMWKIKAENKEERRPPQPTAKTDTAPKAGAESRTALSNQNISAKPGEVKALQNAEVFKGDDITFQFPDGRTEGAYVIDAAPVNRDGTPDQIYVKLVSAQ